MATTTIPWGDGSGDNITLTYAAASGNQSVTVSSDANTGAARTKTVTFTAGNITQQLTVNQAAGSLPYTPVDYIQTDGTAYIDTGVEGSTPKSSHIKVLLSQVGSLCVVLGKGNANTTSQVASMFVLLLVNAAGSTGLGYRYRYTGGPSIVNSVTNQTPFEAKAKLKKGSQIIGIMQEGETTFTTLTKTGNTATSGSTNLYLFRTNYSSAPLPCPSGSRVYFCKIYDGYDYDTLVFDGVPCIYNGAYGLWDKISNSFFGNAAGSGAFTGPQV